MDRADALALLRQNHEFPGLYKFRAVVRAGGSVAVVTALGAMVGDRVRNIEEAPSKNGNYVSVRLDVHLDGAEQVLDVYELLRTLDQVVTLL
jgi:putative lipoic acid-binding regulatory protein